MPVASSVEPGLLAKGEGSAGALAKACGTTLVSLQATNGNELFLISPGTKLTVQNKAGLLYRVKGDGETLDDILRRYRKDAAGFSALKQKVGKLSRKQLEEIAKIKMPDLNCYDINTAVKIIAGSARQMGVECEGV